MNETYKYTLDSLQVSMMIKTKKACYAKQAPILFFMVQYVHHLGSSHNFWSLGEMLQVTSNKE